MAESAGLVGARTGCPPSTPALRTISWNVTINGALLHYALDDLPFGGVGPSGMGAYHGVEGFRRLSHARGIFLQGKWSAGNLLRAPFGQRADTILRMLFR